MQRQTPRLRITEVGPHLICALCGGYLIDATTIVECLHSFCKTCIVRYLEASKYCPICEVLVHKTRPLQNIRLDHTLQDIVYKLVPGLFKDEMQRRREYYKNAPTIRTKHRSGEKSSQTSQRTIFTADEMFSVSLEFCSDGILLPGHDGDTKGRKRLTDVRYLRCPAGVTVAHLVKFIHVKFGLPDTYQVEVFHRDGNLREHYTLMDVAYIYSWRREGVLKLYYSIFKKPVEIVVPPLVEPVKVTCLDKVTCSDTKTTSSVTTKQEGDVKPTSLLTASSFCRQESLHHDLSPLELIATVANDLSSIEEGRGLKRKAEAADLCYENDEDSASEIQMKKSIEHAIDLCSNNSNQDDNTENSSVKEETNVHSVDNKVSSGGADPSGSGSGDGDKVVSLPSTNNSHAHHGKAGHVSDSNRDVSVNHSKSAGSRSQKQNTEQLVTLKHTQQQASKSDSSLSSSKEEASLSGINNNSVESNSSKTTSKSISDAPRDKSHDPHLANQKTESQPVSTINGFCKTPDVASSSPSKQPKTGHI